MSKPRRRAPAGPAGPGPLRPRTVTVAITMMMAGMPVKTVTATRRGGSDQ